MALLILFFVVMPFAVVLLYGAPYLPTKKQYANYALDMLELKEGDVFVDLGSGDGTVLVEAARRGYKCYGYELNPVVWLASKIRTYPHRQNITIYCGNYWRSPLPKNTKGVFVFLLDKYMPKLDAKLNLELKPGTKLVSYTFQIPGKAPELAKNALFLYLY